MREDALTALLAQARRSVPSVRAAALLRIARVQSVSDLEVALRTFDEGLATVTAPLERFQRLFESGSSIGRGNAFQELEELRSEGVLDHNGHLLHLACTIAAAIAPDRIDMIDTPRRPVHLLFPDMLVQIMLEHGQIGGAVSWVLGTKALHRFPFHSVATLVDRVGDDETRAVLLKKSYEAWQRVPGNPFGDGLIGGFAKHWRVLPKAEAQRIVRDLAMHARARRYEPGAGAYGPENAVRISGAGDNILFRLLHILRKLDPELAECVLAERSEVAAAAHRYPDGLDSIQSEAEALGLPAEAPVTAYIRFYHGEQEADFDRRLCAASGTGNLRPVLDAALEILDGDLRRRDIPEFWLATRSLRQVMYRAGKQNGREAAGWLDQIKHANVRLLVAIELEASLAGLPELQSLVLFHESAAAG